MPWNENCINIATNHYMEFFQACFVHFCPEEKKATISTSQLPGTYFKALDTLKWLQIHPKNITKINFWLASSFGMIKNDFPVLSRGDNGHWSVGNLILWYFIRHQRQKSSHQALQWQQQKLRASSASPASPCLAQPPPRLSSSQLLCQSWFSPGDIF